LPKDPATTLLASGPVSRSFLAALPSLLRWVRYVRSPQLKLASRISNQLRVGAGIVDLKVAAQCDLLLICVPRERLDALLVEILSTDIDWSTHSFVLCDDAQDSNALAALRVLGAARASLCPLDPADPSRLLVEGDYRAVMRLRRAFEGADVRLHEVTQGTRARVQAASTMLSSLLHPFFDAANELMRSSEIPGNIASMLLEAQVRRSLIQFLKSGRKGWSGALAERDQGRVMREWAALFSHKPAYAQLYLENALLALEHYSDDLEWRSLLSRLPRRARVVASEEASLDEKSVAHSA
jgi:hypothetical protein